MYAPSFFTGGLIARLGAGRVAAAGLLLTGLMAIGSFSSGGVLGAYGWDMVLWVSFVPLALAAAVLMARRGATAR